MTNGIRQVSIVCPHIFNIYVDEINLLLSHSKMVCRIGDKPSSRALNKLLAVCDAFAKKAY